MNTFTDERFVAVIDRSRFSDPTQFADAVTDAIQSTDGAIAVVGSDGEPTLRLVQAAVDNLAMTALVAPGAVSDFSPTGPVAATLNQTATTGTPDSVALVVTGAEGLSPVCAEDLARTQAHLALGAVVAIFEG